MANKPEAKSRKPAVKSRYRHRGEIHLVLTTGEHRNPEHPRHERHALGISPRQQRKRLKLARRNGNRG